MKTNEQSDKDFSSTKDYCECQKCNKLIVFEPDDIRWDERGFGYSTALVSCQECGCPNVLKHIEDYGLSISNTDERLFR